MPAYRMQVTIEYDAKRTDSGDRQSEIIAAIENIRGVRVDSNYDGADEVYDVPTQPDESGS